LKHW